MPVPVFSTGEVLTAANMNAVGLWKISSGSITAVSSTNYARIQTAFSSSYDNYRLIVNGTGSAAGSITIRLGNSNTPAQTNYQFAVPYWYPTAGSDGVIRSSTSSTTFFNLGFYSTVRTSITCDILRPFAAETTQFVGAGTGQANSTLGNALYSLFGYHDTATSYSELFIGTNGTTTFTGTYALYGYRN